MRLFASACAAVAWATVGCGQERIPVSQVQATDYNHGELQRAVDVFVTSGRTPAAFAAFARTVFELRPGMDRSTAELAERRLVVLALAPVNALANQPIEDQVDQLALTVWPALLADEIEADEILRKRDQAKHTAVMPRKDETADGYLIRLCGNQLKADCKDVVPEYHGAIVSAVVVARAAERARIAVADCLMCSTEPGWSEAVHGWEQLDRAASATRDTMARRGDPANWPIAGQASIVDPGLPWVEISPAGEVVIDGKAHGAQDRVSALIEVREQVPALALHVRPEATIAQLRALYEDARKAGAQQVAVLARSPEFPWERRIYWITEGSGHRPTLRSSDSLQLLVHAIDHVGVGTTARLDGIR